MYTTLVIFYTANYCQKIKNFFDVEDLIAAGLVVEFWNLSKITANETLKPATTFGLLEICINTLDELKCNIKRHSCDRCLYLSYINYAPYSFNVYRILSKYKVDILYSTSGVIPEIENDIATQWSKLFDFKIVCKALKFRCQRLLLKTPLFRPAKYVLVSCNKATCDYKTDSQTIYVNCNSGDYNSIIKLKNQSSMNKVIFIDQYLPYHNDFTLRGLQHIDARKYYKSLNRYFQYIEDKYNCKVIVCAHPSATKYSQQDFFEGRDVVYNETAKQVSQSIGVLAHYSTAISFPVILKKPIVFLTSDEIDSKYDTISKYPLKFSEILQSPLVNIDRDAAKDFSEINIDAYKAYLYDYLTTPVTQDVNNANVLIAIANNDYRKYQ